MINCGRKILFAIAIILCWITAPAQYRFDSWTTDDGLPQNGVRRITQSPDGYIWFTTFDGLVRFDGVKFTVFNKSTADGIVNNRFWVVRAAADGTIWASTERGDLTFFRKGVFTSYAEDRVPGDQILDFVPDENGETMIETRSDFYYLRDGAFILAKPTGNDGTPKQIHRGQTGAVWTIGPLETREERDGATRIYKLELRNINFYNGTCFEDRRGGLWVADVGGLYYLRKGQITHYTAEDGVPAKTEPHRFWEDDDGSLWFATGDYNYAGVGLVRFKNGRFTTFGKERGLSNDRIFDVLKDREGTIWLSTEKGLNRFRRQIITSLSVADGLIGNETNPILMTRSGDILIGTAEGLSRYRDGKFINTVLRLDQSKNIVGNVQSLCEDSRGRIWIGLFGGLMMIDERGTHDVSKLLGSSQTVFAIHNDSRGDMWFATERGGVIQLRDDKPFAQFTVAEGLAGNDVKAIHEARDGSLWFGTYGGLSHLKDGAFTNYRVADGLASDLVRSIAEDADGALWIGTYDGGMSRLKDGRFFNFNSGNGFNNNGVFATVEDRHGNFWISSNRGITRVNKQQLNDFADGRVASYESFVYGKQDGMLNNECNGGRQPSSLIDAQGRIWFPTREGVAIVSPELLRPNPLPPGVEIESVEIDRVAVPFDDVVRVDPSQTQFDINYTGLSFIKSDQLRFRYRLAGLDDGWIDAGTKRSVTYAHLPPGDYVFTVTAANVDGVWNPTGRSIKLVVLAPFYRTWKFFVAIVLLAALIVFLIDNLRVRQLKKLNSAQEMFARRLIESQEAERKRIAQELHDGLGQNLLVIKNRAALGLAVKGNEQTDEQFNEIQDSVTEALGEVRSIAYNLRPIHIERLGLTSTIEEMIERVDETSEIRIGFDIEPIDGVFSPENEMNLYRVVQECLNNVIKHSRASRANVTIEREDANVVLTVKDDGRGFDPLDVDEKHGLGLNGMAERVKILGGTLTIESEEGHGTTVVVEITPEGAGRQAS